MGRGEQHPVNQNPGPQERRRTPAGPGFLLRFFYQSDGFGPDADGSEKRRGNYEEK